MKRGRTLLDRAIDPSLAVHAAAVLAFLYLPIAVLVVFSFSASSRATVWGGFSLRWYEALTHDRDVLAALEGSLVIGLATAVLSTVIGTATALGLERLSRRRRTAGWDVAVMLPIMVPDLVQGVALLVLFVLAFRVFEHATGIGLHLGRTTVVLAHTAFAASYVVAVVRARLAGLPRDLEDAASDLGATPWQAFRRVTLPLLRPAIVGGALLAFTLSLDEFVITFFTCGVHATTLPLHVWSMLRKGVTPEINALSALLVLASIGLVAVSGAVQRRR